MTYLEKLTDLVCQEKNIEKDLNQKEYYVSITSKNNDRLNNQIFAYDFWMCNSEQEAIWLSIEKIRKQKENKYNQILIELCYIKDKEIEYHHVSWYGDIKKIDINVDFIDSTKPLSQQSEEVLKNIFEALAS